MIELRDDLSAYFIRYAIISGHVFNIYVYGPYIRIASLLPPVACHEPSRFSYAILPPVVTPTITPATRHDAEPPRSLLTTICRAGYYAAMPYMHALRHCERRHYYAERSITT